MPYRGGEERRRRRAGTGLRDRGDLDEEQVGKHGGKAHAVANGVADRPAQSARRSGRIWSTCGSLHLAATTMQCEVEAALEALLEADEVPEYESVKARVVPGEALACPEVLPTA